MKITTQVHVSRDTLRRGTPEGLILAGYYININSFSQSIREIYGNRKFEDLILF